MAILSPMRFIAITLAVCLVACDKDSAQKIERPQTESPQAAIAPTPTDPSPEQIQQSYLRHTALAQLHRWYQIYERPEGGIKNALDILSKDVFIKSSLGEARGHQAYQQRVASLPSQWKNAHFVKSSNIKINNDGSMAIQANVLYMNQGMQPNGQVRTADLAYAMDLTPGSDVLPKFSQIKISPVSEGEAAAMRDAYGDNRLRSLVHYWLAIIEHPARNPEPAREILADDFQLNFSSGAITDFEGFKAWLTGPASQVAASIHIIRNFTYEDLGNGQYTLKVDFDWNGILPNGNEMTAKTRHRWTVVNKITDRFARIKSVDVEILEPFALKSK